jgi:hypothetical protein
MPNNNATPYLPSIHTFLKEIFFNSKNYITFAHSFERARKSYQKYGSVA